MSLLRGIKLFFGLVFLVVPLLGGDNNIALRMVIAGAAILIHDGVSNKRK